MPTPKLITWDALVAGAGRSWRRGSPMDLPVPTVYLHHTVTEMTDDPIADAAAVNDIDEGRFGKVSYSWLVHEASNSWIEGETIYRGAHTINNANESLNGISLGVGVIGNFHSAQDPPTPRKPSSALLGLIAAGLNTFARPYLTKTFDLRGHRDVYATACCGDLLYPHLPAIRVLLATPPPVPPAPTPEDDDMAKIQLVTCNAHPDSSLHGVVWKAVDNVSVFPIPGNTDAGTLHYYEGLWGAITDITPVQFDALRRDDLIQQAAAKVLHG